MRRERGSSAVLVLVVLVGLLGVGGVALLSSRSEVDSAGVQRRHQQALYAAESGAAAGMEFLRTACTVDALFGDLVEPSNQSPQQPTAIQGNLLPAGQNVFDAASELRYEVTILNNPGDPGFAAGDDEDARVILRVVGLGPDSSRAMIEMEVVGDDCINSACQTDYAQRGITARNDSLAACANRLASGAITSIALDAP